MCVSPNGDDGKAADLSNEFEMVEQGRWACMQREGCERMNGSVPSKAIVVKLPSPSDRGLPIRAAGQEQY